MPSVGNRRDGRGEGNSPHSAAATINYNYYMREGKKDLHLDFGGVIYIHKCIHIVVEPEMESPDQEDWERYVRLILISQLPKKTTSLINTYTS